MAYMYLWQYESWHTCIPGTTAEVLREEAQFSMFDFSPVDEYCIKMGVGAKNEERQSDWWHHGPHAFETEVCTSIMALMPLKLRYVLSLWPSCL